MPLEIYIHVETLDENKQWQANNKAAYSVERTQNELWEFMPPLEVDVPFSLMSTLVMGSIIDYEFAFPVRGLPPNPTDEVRGTYHSEDGEITWESYLTRKELETKSSMLMLIGTNDALSVKPLLDDLINAMPPAPANPENQRIVFWFTK